VVPARAGAPKVVSGGFDEDARLLDWGREGAFILLRDKTAAHL